MATSIKISALPTLATAPTGDDLLVIVDAPGSNPVTKQINVATFFSNVNVGKIVANGSVGTANQVLLSNATGTFWSSDLNLVSANVGSGAFYVNSSSFNVTTTNTYVTSNVTITGTNTNISANVSFTGSNTYVQNKIQVGNAAGYDFGSLASIEIDASQNSYVQIVIQNANTGNQNSGDLVITTDNGNDTFGYVDLGINGSNYSNATYGITGAGDAYLYSANSQLVIGTATVKDVVIHAGGTAATNRIMTVNTTGVTVATNTFTLGTSTSAANGYTFLPNGLKLNWGWVSANSTTAGAVTFTSAFTTNAYIVTATSNSAVTTYGAAVVSWTKTGANVVTANVTSTNVFWQAIGS